MYSGGSKKLTISPQGEFTSTSTTVDSLEVRAISSINSITPNSQTDPAFGTYAFATKNGPSSTNYSVESGDYIVTLNVPSFSINTDPGIINHSIAPPQYSQYESVNQYGYIYPQSAPPKRHRLQLNLVAEYQNSSQPDVTIRLGYAERAGGVSSYTTYSKGAGRSSNWTQTTVAAREGYQNDHAASTNEKFEINMPISGTVKFKYQWVSGAGNGKSFSSGGYPTTLIASTHSTTLSDSMVSLGNVDTSLQIQRPSNFVELKSGGIQVVSSGTKHVKIPRLANDLDDNDTIFSAVGGTMVTHHIRPNTASVSDLGNPYHKFKNLNGLDISGLAVSLVDSVTSSTTSSNLSHNKDSYVKLPGGVIIQWGSIQSGSSSGLKAVSFPVTFPTSLSAAVCSTVRPNAGGSGYNHVSNLTTTGMNILLDSSSGFWIAIGH